MKTQPKNAILVTGASGFIGLSLVKHFLDRGYYVHAIDVRAVAFSHPNLYMYTLDIAQHDLPLGLIEKVDTVVHLAGEPIYGYWSKAKKDSIYNSRVMTAERIKKAIGNAKVRPSVYVTASAIGIYGDKGERILDEESEPGDDFLARVCLDWESRAKDISLYGVREVRIRTAPVIGEGGLFSILKRSFIFGTGAWIGSGRQWFSWIFYEDLLRLYIAAVEDSKFRGPYNAAAGTIRQKAFMQHIAAYLGKPRLIGVPVLFLKIRYGSLANTMLASQRITGSQALQDAGFEVAYTDLSEALEALPLQNKQKVPEKSA